VAVSKHTDLKRLSFRLSTDGKRAFCMVRDDLSGRFLAMPAKTAAAVHRVRMAAAQDQSQDHRSSATEPDHADRKEAAQFATSLSHLRDHELFGSKQFNPIFVNLPLFELGPFQPALRPMARVLVGWVAVVLLAALLAVTFVLGARNDWAIWGVFENIWSLQGLLTFALVAPFLKVFHELGHVLAATRFGVTVRKAGFYIIGLYPMPYVDCTEADFSASRGARILISLAGIWVDLIIGLLAFILWHFTSGSFLQTIFGNIFLYSTLNSLLFNMNPLIKLDGYYALVDVLGQRNLYTRSQRTLGHLAEWMMTAGAGGLLPRNGQDVAFVAYAVAAFCYRVMIMYVIAISLLPQHFGIGAVLVIWGAVTLFLSPLLQDKPTQKNAANPALTRRRWIMRCALWGGVAAALLFIRPQQFTTIELYLDTSGTYGVTVPVTGRIESDLQRSFVAPGQGLVTLSNVALEQEMRLLEFEQAAAERLEDSVRGADPAKSVAARQQINALQQRDAALRQDRDRLAVVADRTGIFVPSEAVTVGAMLPSGTTLGFILPDSGLAIVQGQFPERYLEAYRSADLRANLRFAGGEILKIPTQALTLQTTLELDRERGTRAYVMRVQVDRTPTEVAGQRALLRLRFGRKPLWQHLHFWFETQLIKFREAQVIDRASRLEP
jgi:putative peptide zinc metalloprotease protein